MVRVKSYTFKIKYFYLMTFLLNMLCELGYSRSIEEVLSEKKYLYNEQIAAMLGSDLILTAKEEEVNTFITTLKNQIQDDCYNDVSNCNYTNHFFHYKDEVKEQPLFKILKDMPKGGLLHIHDTGIMSPDYLVNLTYWDNLYLCKSDEEIIFKFSKSTPDDDCSVEWKLMNETRSDSGDIEAFDNSLRRLFTIVVDNPEEAYADYNKLWLIFQNYFIRTSPLLTYKPVWEQYFYDAMKSLRADNIMYVEVRSVLPNLYDLDGNVFDVIATAKSLKKVSDQFVFDYPDFIGMKLIYAPSRLATNATVENYLSIAKELKNGLPDFFAGFDLVGNEELMPLSDFDSLLAAAGEEIDYFFHVGETSWNGFKVDENLYDAIALGSKRLGHAFALPKHPILFETVKTLQTPIEVCPISNSISPLNMDLRNHPLASYLAQGMAVVVSSDDPGVWEAEPLTHDFYAAFVTIANRHADLKLLKKLAYNSLNYSTISNKVEIIADFDDKWSQFIDLLIGRINTNYYTK